MTDDELADAVLNEIATGLAHAAILKALDYPYTPTCDAGDCPSPAEYRIEYLCSSTMHLACDKHRRQFGDLLNDRTHPLIHTCRFAPLVRFHNLKTFQKEES